MKPSQSIDPDPLSIPDLIGCVLVMIMALILVILAV